MGTTPVCQITIAGCARPTFADCLTYVQEAYRAIYGQDTYLGADSQDGQFMALLANAIHDCNGETLAAYNAFSPSTAIGAGLSSVVKINGIRRKSATYSTADLLIVGQVGATITNGMVRDTAGYLWSLPATVIIPPAGQLTVTATCQTLGAVTAAIGGISNIATPTYGWQSATNLTAATSGLPIETDNQLRQRQSYSTALPAQTILASMQGALLAISGVSRVRIYENDSDITDANGIPGHSVAVIVEGGDVMAVAQTIAAKKSPGVGTFGDVVTPLTDAYGISRRVAFFRPVLKPVAWYVTLRPFKGYTVDVATAIRTNLAAFTNSLGIGQTQRLASAYPVADLTGLPASATFEIVGLQAKRADNTNDAYGDIIPAYNEALTCIPEDVRITTVTT